MYGTLRGALAGRKIPFDRDARRRRLDLAEEDVGVVARAQRVEGLGVQNDVRRASIREAELRPGRIRLTALGTCHRGPDPPSR